MKLFFSAIVALGTLALPQAHSTLVDFNGAGTSEFASNFIQSGTAFTETPGIGIGGTDGLAYSAYGGAIYTAETFDMTSSTVAAASTLFYFQGLPENTSTIGEHNVISFSIQLDPLFNVLPEFGLSVWAAGVGFVGDNRFPTSNCFLVARQYDRGGNVGYFGHEIQLVPGHWYRLTAGFANESEAFRISGKIEDYGTDGLQSVSVISEGSWLNASTSPGNGPITIDPALAADSSAYIALSAHKAVTAFDNFEFQAGEQVPEPSSTALLTCAGLFVLNRRRSISRRLPVKVAPVSVGKPFDLTVRARPHSRFIL